jgi:alcohol dehydrogenase
MRFFAHFLPWREPILLSGENAHLRLREQLKTNHQYKFLIVTDIGIIKADLLKHIITAIEGYPYIVYDQTSVNPTVNEVLEAYNLYLTHDCTAIIGLGGGSALDLAKGVGIKVARPNKKLQKLRGVLKVLKKLPPLIMIPTTAGTGSEVTLAAVLSDHDNQDKFAIIDPQLVPKIAILDPIFTKSLPKSLTATTGMDALTHAVEAYIGKSNTKWTKEKSLNAIKIIFSTLEKSYEYPNDLDARLEMLKASYDAGIAFSRAYVGNIHAISHQFSAYHQIPHGMANAIIMPHVLKSYQHHIFEKIAEISDYLNLTSKELSAQEKTNHFILSIENMNKRMNIPHKIVVNHLNDIESMAKKAFQEANPLYPVPVIFKKRDFMHMIKQVSMLKGVHHEN